MGSLIDTLWPAHGNLRTREGELIAEPGVPYAGEDSQPKQHFDLFQPPDPVGAPLVLFVHGGAWRQQDRRYLPRWLGLYANVGHSLARRGLVTAVASYRQREGHQSLRDLKDALAVLRDHGGRLGAATEAVVVVGHSAGAHLAACLAQESSPPVRAVVCMAGYYDPRGFARTLGRNRMRLTAIFGDDDRWNVLARLGPGSPPMLAIAGENEPEPITRAHVELGEAAAAAGAQCRRWVVPGMGHMGLVLSMGRQIDVVGDRVARFAHEVTSSTASAGG